VRVYSATHIRSPQRNSSRSETGALLCGVARSRRLVITLGASIYSPNRVSVVIGDVGPVAGRMASKSRRADLGPATGGPSSLLDRLLIWIVI
jgi:hypothetical protein